MPGRGGPRCRGRRGLARWTVRPRIERFAEPAVLLLLRGGPTHGYELLERLAELAEDGGRVDLGNLYRLLRALEADGLVSSDWRTESGPPRRVYRLTASGGRLLDGWASSLQGMRTSIDRFLALYRSGR